MFDNHYYHKESWNYDRTEYLLAETFDERANAALVLVETNYCGVFDKYKNLYELRLDVSRYLPAIREIWYPRIHRLTANIDIGVLKSSVSFSLCNVSPSLWNNGFGVSYYLQGVVYRGKKDLSESMKDMLRTGIGEKNIVEHMDEMTHEALDGLYGLFKEFGGYNTITPLEDDILF